MPSQAPLLPYVFFDATPPELPVRHAGDDGGPEYVVTARLAETSAHCVRLDATTNTGEALAIELHVVADGIMRVLLTANGESPARARVAQAMEPAADVQISATDERVTINSPALNACLTLAPFQIAWFDANHDPLLRQEYNDVDVNDRLTSLPFGFSRVNGQRVAFHEAFYAEPDEHFYGFGERFTRFDKRGQRIENWNYDALGCNSQRAYKSVPFFMSSRGYGIFVDTMTRATFDVVANSQATCNIVVPDAALDYYVIAGTTPRAIITHYAQLVSFPPLPPKWAFGLWMSSGFGEDCADNVYTRINELRAREIPCDVLHLDTYWQRFGHWSDLVWDDQNFPDPDTLIEDAHAAHFKICLWINPYVSVESDRYQEAQAAGYLLRTPAGTPYIVDMWAGTHPTVGIIDFTNPAACDWFRELLRGLLRQGVDVFKTDFAEGVPYDAVSYDGRTGSELHNPYALLFNDLVSTLCAEENAHNGLVWARSTYAGGQRHAAHWSGDVNCTFSGLAATIRGGLSLAMSGYPFWGHDIGGFHTTPSTELYIRWCQFGALSPMARAHGMSSRLPWDFGDEAAAIFRQYMRLRYSLLPYFYHYASEASTTGWPIMRPMVFEYPDDPAVYDLELQYMLGENLLVAPVFNAHSRRTVYLPAGEWVDFWTGHVYAGPQTLSLSDIPLDQLPLFVKANTLLPRIEPGRLWTGEAPFHAVYFDAYARTQGDCALRDGDGTTEISAEVTGTALVLQLDSPKRVVGLRWMLPDPARSIARVRVNDRPVAHVAGMPDDETPGMTWWRDAAGRLLVRIVQA